MNTPERQSNDLIELSITDKNYNGGANVWFNTTQVNRRKLPELLKQKNYSFIIWKGGNRKSANFSSAQGTVIDVDNGLTIQEAIDRLKVQGLNYIIIPSKSHTAEKHRFHCILFFDKPVYSRTTYQKIATQVITKMFPEADGSVTDAARFIYGSPQDAETSEYYEGHDLNTISSGPLWDNTLEIKTSAGETVVVNELKEKTACYCPFHSDSNPSAFIEYSEASNNWYIRCSTCDETFWMEKTSTPIEIQCDPYWSYGTDVWEFGLAGDDFYFEKIGMKKFHILSRTDSNADEREQAFKYLVRSKHISHISRIDYLGSISADKHYYEINNITGIIKVHYAPIPTQIRDNDSVESYLADRFGEYKEFIKKYLAVFCYTNYQNLPTVILKGHRGNGKSTFAEIVGEIYRPLTTEWQGHEKDFTYEVEKKLLIVEENESSAMSQYKTLKKYSGQKYAQVKKKFKDPYNVRNNMNIMLLTNESIPLYVSREEMPANENNNQFFVYEFTAIEKDIDTDIQTKILERLGNYIRTELRDVFQTLKFNGCRYSIPVPITKYETALFQDNSTDLEADVDRVIQRLALRDSEEYYREYKPHLDNSYMPIEVIKDFNTTTQHYNRVIKNMKKRSYLVGDLERKQYKDKRCYCYKMTDKLIDEIDADFTKIE
ncbi:MAG: hypothetical protein HQ509_00605 [Candidatus Marinimicrobia bacterium]|nr:hypothetical protein [Candidatus Neomarinimicrobiota bacterium]